jgi:hypothetical protein
MSKLDALFSGVSAPVRRVLDASLAGSELSVEDALVLDGARGRDLLGLCGAADELRGEQAGAAVTYVVNGIIEFA